MKEMAMNEAVLTPDFIELVEEEFIEAGQDVAVICSDFPDKVVQGYVVRLSDKPEAWDWALVNVWYWDDVAQGYGKLITWEPISNMRPLYNFLAEGRKLDEAVAHLKTKAAAFAAA
jgi:hypothetical protein